MSKNRAKLAEISAEIDALISRHRHASNEVCAAIAHEALEDAINLADIPVSEAEDYFLLHFPTLALYC
ncbi:MAG: hypothetical protein AMS22_13065 [Thiotrichales bacterium SG8_50]|nr:MAG: hypothetical protein AMS22_13065 [Thiotrichales bacterium SG8_50]